MDPIYIEFGSRLLIAMLLGIVIGTERVLKHKTAGMRTYAMVAMGAALFSMSSHLIYLQYYVGTDYNTAQIPAAIVAGVGFLGAGLMIWKDSHLVGLTSATGFWICAAIGMATGYGLYPIAIFATILTFFVFGILYFVEMHLRKYVDKKDGLLKSDNDQY